MGRFRTLSRTHTTLSGIYSLRSSSMKKRARFYLLLFIGLFLVFVFVDSMGTFDSRPYYEVPHGSHTHYVPKDCDPPLTPVDAPTREPGPGERITCEGQIVPIESP